MAPTERIPVLLDTDIGSDIDDAVALAYLLREPRCELLGITTVTGDVQKRAALSEIVCRAGGRSDIPIHCGRREVLTRGAGQPLVPHYDTVSDHPHSVSRPENTALDFLRSTIRSRPGEIVLISIGPYSNLALLFAVDPEIPFLVRDIVSMGGVFFTLMGPEWNSICDPTASEMVYVAPRKTHLTVGLDVTMQCRMEASEVLRRFRGEPLETVAVMAKQWFQRTPEMTFHDPLTAMLVFHPELCAYKCGTVTTRSGKTVLKEGDGPDRVASSVNVDRFFAEYFRVFA